MNIIINPTSFNGKCIFFSDRKKNTIINGCFSKIIYSPEYFTMNGIFFIIPFIIKSYIPISNPSVTENSNFFRSANPSLSFDDKSSIDNLLAQDNKYTVYFYTHDVKNLQYITLLSKIENTIINTYKEINGLKKRSNLVLTNQLYKGFFKIYKEKRFRSTTNPSHSSAYIEDFVSEKTLDTEGVTACVDRTTFSVLRSKEEISGPLRVGYLGNSGLTSVERSSKEFEKNAEYMLKISGVWENAEEIGITYKFIEI
jgi:hypothetical protein